jgi:hypothetical protein
VTSEDERHTVEYKMLHDLLDRRKLLENDSVYRVMVSPETGAYEVVCIGMECVDSKIEESYSSINDMPDWFRRKLAVMFTVTPVNKKLVGPRITQEGFPILQKPWTMKDPQVEGIGTRETKDVFWIVPD